MKSLGREHFERVYAASDDPWSFLTSPYEAEKYDRTLAMLGASYENVLEIGCSIGVFTRRLAERAHRVLAVDISVRALELAAAACSDLSNVTFARCDVTRAYPEGTFDLVVIAEVAYYWSSQDFARTQTAIAGSLGAAGELLLVHFLPEDSADGWGGDAVHEAFLRDARFERLRGSRYERYRIDVFHPSRKRNEPVAGV